MGPTERWIRMPFFSSMGARKRTTTGKMNAIVARTITRKPETPSFALNRQVNFADWDQVCGTHQGQRRNRKLQSKAPSCLMT